MSVTRVLARNISNCRYEDLPPAVVEKGRLAIMDSIGNAIGGYPLHLSRTFLDMAEGIGGGVQEATIIGSGAKVSVPLAAFGNGALTTMLDYSLVRGALAVPAALAAGESQAISGKEFITSVVAGCETIGEGEVGVVVTDNKTTARVISHRREVGEAEIGVVVEDFHTTSTVVTHGRQVGLPPSN